MDSPEALIIRKKKHKSPATTGLYLQKDHQKLLIVTRSVTADIFLQFAAELWREKGEDCLHLELTTGT